MRVQHRDYGQIGTIVNSEPEYVMGEPYWAVRWDGGNLVAMIADDNLIDLD